MIVLLSLLKCTVVCISVSLTLYKKKQCFFSTQPIVMTDVNHVCVTSILQLSLVDLAGSERVAKTQAGAEQLKVGHWLGTMNGRCIT